MLPRPTTAVIVGNHGFDLQPFDNHRGISKSKPKTYLYGLVNMVSYNY